MGIAAGKLIMVALVILALISTRIGVSVAASKRRKAAMRPKENVRATPPMGKAPGTEKAESHDHIRSTELSGNRKLDQLKALKEAGLLTQEEYDQRYQKILKGR